MSIFSCVKKCLCDAPQTKDPLWWTIYGPDGWSNVPAEVAEDMAKNLRWVSNQSGGAIANRGLQRCDRTEYWRVAGCPPSLKKVTPVFYHKGEFSAGEPKWYVHDIYWKYPPI